MEEDDYRGPSGALTAYVYVLGVYAMAGLLCWACGRMTADAAPGSILAPARAGEAVAPLNRSPAP